MISSLKEYYDVIDGYDDSSDVGIYPIGSLIVRPGCTFYQFWESHYNGVWTVYEGPGIWPKIEKGYEFPGGCARGTPSYMCRCSMR